MSNGNGAKMAEVLASLVSKLDLPTLIVVMLMGGGNILTTRQDGRLTREEAIQVAREIHELHAQLDDSAQRQKSTLEKLDQLLKWQQSR